MAEKTYKGDYLILSLKWSDGASHLVWWRAENNGYTPNIDNAGRYSAEAVAANPSYYDNEDSTRAVPLYNVMEGLIGPIHCIVATTYQRPKRTFVCHACRADVTINPDHSPLSCRECSGYTCGLCYDEDHCGAKPEMDRVRRTVEES